MPDPTRLDDNFCDTTQWLPLPAYIHFLPQFFAFVAHGLANAVDMNVLAAAIWATVVDGTARKAVAVRGPATPRLQQFGVHRG